MRVKLLIDFSYPLSIFLPPVFYKRVLSRVHFNFFFFLLTYTFELIDLFIHLHDNLIVNNISGIDELQIRTVYFFVFFVIFK